MQPFRLARDLLSLDHGPNSSTVAAHPDTAITRRGRLECTLSRRAKRSIATNENTSARLRSLVQIVCIPVVVTSSVLSSGSIRAEAASRVGNSIPTNRIDRFADFIVEASRRFDVPTNLIRAVMRVESGVDARAVSPKGAMGLMQIMPETYSELRDRYALGANPYDPRNNILAGAAYLREMHDRFGAPGFLAAYNVGPRRYEEHLRNWPPPT